MRKIKNGKQYNTDTAELIGTWDNGLLPNNFDYVEETLYRKKTGEYFLHGAGGANTRYAKVTGQNSWRGSWDIIPLNFDTAKSWVEDHLSADKYEECFGPIEEDDSRTTVTLSLSAGVVAYAKREAAKAGMTLSGWVESKLSDIQK